MADSPILDYYRAVDHGCSLQRIGETYIEDSYAIGMGKGYDAIILSIIIQFHITSEYKHFYWTMLYVIAMSI